MLALSSLNKLLSHVLSPPALHTAVLFTASGALVSYATTTGGAGNSSDPLSPSRPRPKDDIRVLVGLASQVWAETKEDGEGLVDSELGRIIVLPIVPPPKQRQQQQQQDGDTGITNINSNSNSTSNTSTGAGTGTGTGTSTPNQPSKDSALLLALNATDEIEWGDLQHKAQSLAAHLAKPLAQVQAKLDSAPPLLSKPGRR